MPDRIPLPHETVLRALVAHLRKAVPRTNDQPHFRVRHWRFRNPSQGEWPCLSVQYVSHDDAGTNQPSDGSELSTSEIVMELPVNLIADAALPPEGEDQEDGEDPTGLGTPGDMLLIALSSLFRPNEEAEKLGGVAWDIRSEGAGDAEDVSTADNARLSERIVVLYRVRADAPQILLIG